MKIIFGAQEPDLQTCRSILEWLGSNFAVEVITDANVLFWRLLAGDVDLVILYAGAMVPGPLAWVGATNLNAGLVAVRETRKVGCVVPVLIIESFAIPRWAYELEGVRFVRISFSRWWELSDVVDALLPRQS